MKDRDSGKLKLWEKRRRDRLKESFHKLAQLLPQYDPAKLPPQNEILDKATEFVKELRLSNSRLLTQQTQTQADEKCKLIQELQDEVNKLILRVKQLTSLLTKANISIPTGPCIKSLGKRKLKWSNKMLPTGTENKKRRLAVASEKEVEITKENKKDGANNQTNPGALNSGSSTPLRETNTSNGEKKNEVLASSNLDHHQLAQPHLHSVVVSGIQTVAKNSPTEVPRIPAVNPIPLTLSLPPQSTQTTTIILTPRSLGPVITGVTIPAPHRILPKLSEQNFLPKLPIVRIRQPIQVVKKTRQRKKKAVVSAENSKAVFAIAPKEDQTTSDATVPNSEITPAQKNSLLEVSNSNEQISSTMSSTDSSASSACGIVGEVNAVTLISNVPNILEEHLIPTESVKTTGDKTASKSPGSGESAIELLDNLNQLSSVTRIEHQASNADAVDASLSNEKNDNMRIEVQAETEGVKDFSNLPSIIEIEKPDDISSPAAQLTGSSEDAVNDEADLTARLETESQSHKLYSSLQNDAIPQPLVSRTESPSALSDRETISESLLDKSLKVATGGAQIVANETVTTNLDTSLKSNSSEERIIEKQIQSFEICAVSSQSKVGNSNPNSNPFEIGKDSVDVILNLEPQVLAAQVTHSANVMSDSLQDIADLIEPEVPVKSSSTNINNTIDKQIHVSSEENVTSVKIGECIARSIDLIDQPEAELMELSGDCHWGDGQSPKSPISPTQMFLSMFPLLPRESIISSETSNHHSGIKATGNYSSVKSFYIDSMLPEDNSASNDFNRSLNIPGSVTSILNTSVPSSHNHNVLNPNSLDQIHSMEVQCVSVTPASNSSSLNTNLNPATVSERIESSDQFSFHLSTINTASVVSPMSNNRCIGSQQGMSRGNRSSVSTHSTSAPSETAKLTSLSETGRDGTTKNSSEKPSKTRRMEPANSSAVIPYSSSNVMPAAATVFSQMNFNSNSTPKNKDAGINWTPFFYPENSATVSANKQALSTAPHSLAVPGFQKSHNTSANLYGQKNEIENLFFRSGPDISVPTQGAFHTTFPAPTDVIDSHKNVTDSTKNMGYRGPAALPGCTANTLNTYKPYMDSVHSNNSQSRGHVPPVVVPQEGFLPPSSNVPQQPRSTFTEIGFNTYPQQSQNQPTDFFCPVPSSVPSVNNDCQQSLANSAKRSQAQQPLHPLNNTPSHYPIVQPSNVGVSTSSQHSSGSRPSKSQNQSKTSSAKVHTTTTRTSKSQTQECRQSQSVSSVPKHKANVVANPLHSGYAPPFEFLSPVSLPGSAPSAPVGQSHPSQLPSVVPVPQVQTNTNPGRADKPVSVDARKNSGEGNSTSLDPSRTDGFQSQNYRQNSANNSHGCDGVRGNPSSRKSSRGTVPKSTASSTSNRSSSNTNTFASLGFQASPANFSMGNNFYYDSILPPPVATHNQYSVGHQSKSRNQPFYLHDLPSVQNFDFIQMHNPIVPPTPPGVQHAVPPHSTKSSSSSSFRRSTEPSEINYNYNSVPLDSNVEHAKNSTSFVTSNSDNYTAVRNDVHSPMLNIGSSKNYYQHHSSQLHPHPSHAISSISSVSASAAVPDYVHIQSTQNRSKTPTIAGQDQNQEVYPGIRSVSDNRPIISQTHQHQNTSTVNNDSSMTQPSAIAHSRPVNWMTDSRPTQQSHPLICNRKQERSSVVTNPFSVSKLVGSGSNTKTNSSSSNNPNSYCVEGLIRKQASTNFNIGHFSTGHGRSQNEPQVTGSGPAPTFFPFQSQSGSEYGSFSSFTHHAHNSHPTYAPVPNASSTDTGGHFDQSQNHNLHLQHHQHHSHTGPNNSRYIPSTPMSNHPHQSDNSAGNNNRNTSLVPPHLHQGQHHPHHGTSSVLNFNLSSIFPEMNENRNCPNTNNNLNNNSSRNSNSATNNVNNIYYTNSSNHNHKS